ncbi:recombination regulator RecX [Oceanobacillus sp. 1P07AA]|uniref:recombination regulator RecX n=1 Tax=Oceanobacillus sp. 1P07AA TaxID=3132293 RepID=UPI0039A6BFCB
MKKIARITTQKKHKNRYNIFLQTPEGDAYGFSVDEAVLIEYRLSKGMELEDEMISILEQKDTLHKAYTLTIHFLSYRMRSEKEVRDYLQKKEVDGTHIDEIIKRLKREKWVDDQQFALMFVRSRMNSSSKGPKMIQQELYEKGVEGSKITIALEQYSIADQKQKVVKLINKKLQSKSKDSHQKRMDQIKQNLMQKGFDSGVISIVIQEMDTTKDTDREWEVLQLQGEKLMYKYQKKHSGFTLKQKVMEGLYRKGFSFDMINQFIEQELQDE